MLVVVIVNCIMVIVLILLLVILCFIWLMRDNANIVIYGEYHCGFSSYSLLGWLHVTNSPIKLISLTSVNTSVSGLE